MTGAWRAIKYAIGGIVVGGIAMGGLIAGCFLLSSRRRSTERLRDVPDSEQCKCCTATRWEHSPEQWEYCQRKALTRKALTIRRSDEQSNESRLIQIQFTEEQLLNMLFVARSGQQVIVSVEYPPDENGNRYRHVRPLSITEIEMLLDKLI